MDEYTKPDLTVQTLNRICDGTEQIDIKFQHAIQIKDATVIICGNKDPKEVYPNVYHLIEARFNVYCLDKHCKPPNQQEEEYIPMF